jgi:hypothetical protein
MPANSKIWNNFKEVIGIIQSLVIIVGLPIGLIQLCTAQKQAEIQSSALNASNKIASANYVLELSKRLDSPKYDKLITVIGQNNIDYPILKRDGGKFREDEVDALLGLYETVGNLFHVKLIDRDMAYNEFSDDFERAFCNKSIQRYMNKARQEDNSADGPQAYFSKFEDISKEFLAIDRKTCRDFE